MSLRTCPVCPGLVPAKSARCPHCDAAIAPARKGRLLRLACGVLGGGAFATTLMACYGGPARMYEPQTPPQPTPSGSASGTETAPPALSGIAPPSNTPQ